MRESLGYLIETIVRKLFVDITGVVVVLDVFSIDVWLKRQALISSFYRRCWLRL
jgi:hypothetical protein